MIRDQHEQRVEEGIDRPDIVDQANQRVSASENKAEELQAKVLAIKVNNESALEDLLNLQE